MFRTAFLTIGAAIALVLTTQAHQTNEPEDKPKEAITLGKEYKITLPQETTRFIWFGTTFAPDLYMTEIPVMLKEGQSIQVTATVAGTNRKVIVNLKDPTGKLIAGSTGLKATTNELKHAEVNADGKYMIVIGSDLTGGVTVVATGPSAKEVSKKEIADKITNLEKELAELKEQYKKLDEKEKQEKKQ